MSKANQQTASMAYSLPAYMPGISVETITLDEQCVFRFLPEIENGQANPHRDTDKEFTAFYRIDQMIRYWGQKEASVIYSAMLEPEDAAELGLTIPELYPYNHLWRFVRSNTKPADSANPQSCARPDLLPLVVRGAKGGAPISYPVNVMTCWAVIYQNSGKIFPQGLIALLQIHTSTAQSRIFDKLNCQLDDGSYAFPGDLVSLKDGPICVLTKFGAYPMRYDAQGKIMEFIDIRVPIPESQHGNAYDFFITKFSTGEFNLETISKLIRPLQIGQTHRRQTVEEQFSLLRGAFSLDLLKEAFYGYPYLPRAVENAFNVRSVSLPQTPAVATPAYPPVGSATVSPEYYQRMRADAAFGGVNFTTPPTTGDTTPKGNPLMGALPEGPRPQPDLMQTPAANPAASAMFTAPTQVAPQPVAQQPAQPQPGLQPLGQPYSGPVPNTHPKMSEVMGTAPSPTAPNPFGPASQLGVPAAQVPVTNPNPGLSVVPQGQDDLAALRAQFQRINGNPGV